MRNPSIFQVSEECVRLGLRAGAMILRDVNITESPPALRAELQRETRLLQVKLLAAGDIRSTPELQSLHAILRKVGANPRRLQPASQRLAQLVIKKGELPAINNLVDLYNLASVQSLCCLGAHDLEVLETPVMLRLLDGTEAFTPLSHADIDPVRPGDFGYVDAVGRVICRLDVMQAAFSKVTPETHHVLVIVEATSGHRSAVVSEILNSLARRINCHCGGDAEIVWLPDS